MGSERIAKKGGRNYYILQKWCVLYRRSGEDDLDLAGGIGYGHTPETAPHRPNGRHNSASRGAHTSEKSGPSERTPIDDRQSATPLGPLSAPRSLYRPSG